MNNPQTINKVTPHERRVIQLIYLNKCEVYDFGWSTSRVTLRHATLQHWDLMNT